MPLILSFQTAKPMTYSTPTSPCILITTALLLLATTACDLEGVSDAANDLGVVVHLDPIETIVNVQVTDLRTGKPVTRPVDLTFEGDVPVVDAFSDPIGGMEVRGGFAAVGLESGWAVGPANPARLTLRARSEGYLPVTRTVAIDESGTATVSLGMVAEHPRQAPSGAHGTRQTLTATSAAGPSEEPATAPVEVAAGPSGEAIATARIDRDVRFRTADGRALEGALRADLVSYEPTGDGLRALTSTIGEVPNGRMVAGAVRFRVRDAEGRTAARFDRPRAKSTTTSGVQLTLQTGQTITDGLRMSHYVLSVVDAASGQTVEIFVPSSVVAGENLTIELDGGDLVVGGTRTAISSLVGTQGLVLVLQGQAAQTCSVAGAVDVVSNGQTGTFTIAVAGNGLFYEATRTITATQTKTVQLANVVTGDVPVFGSTWNVFVQAPDNTERGVTVDVCAASTATIDLPVPLTGLIEATVHVDPNCPAGQKVPYTGPVDGYALNYRKAGTTNAFQSVPRASVTVHTTDTEFLGADVTLPGVEAGIGYEFHGTFDGQSDSRIITMPLVAGGVTTFTDSQLTQHCQ
jgi:hypothetical protein